MKCNTVCCISCFHLNWNCTVKCNAVAQIACKHGLYSLQTHVQHLIHKTQSPVHCFCISLIFIFYCFSICHGIFSILVMLLKRFHLIFSFKSLRVLFLSLLGVRVSSFISIDDKQPRQKSIVGFLKMASDYSSSAQPSKSEMVSVLGSSVSSTWEQYPEPRSPSFTGETSKPFSKWRTESDCASEPQQQTFFQKAHAKRLQKQYEQEETSGPYTDKISKCLPTDSTNNSAFIVRTHKATVKTDETQRCTWISHPDTHELAAKSDSNLPTTNPVSYAAQTKTKSANMLQCFTCPVCFSQIETKDLSSFNQHIDKCLRSELDNKSRSMDGCQYLCEDKNLLDNQGDAEKDHHKAIDFSSVSRKSVLKRNDEGPHTSSSTPLFEIGAHSGFNTPFFKCFESMREKGSLVPHETMSDSGCVSFHQTASSVEVISEPLDMKVSTLTCPVCNQAQDTDDLILFNHHVDMCLNQEVLLEFREAVPPMAQSNSKVKGQCLGRIRYNTE